MNIAINKIMNIDCVEGMRAMPNECIPCTFTSPPYDRIRTFGGHPFEFEKIAEQLFRITMKGGVVVWVVQDQITKGSQSGTCAKQQLFFQQLGFRLHNTLIMQRTGSRTQHAVRYGHSPEYAYVFSKGRPRAINLLRDKPNTTAGCRVRRNHRLPDGTKFSQTYPDRRIAEFGVRGVVWPYPNCNTADKFVSEHSAVMYEDIAEDHIRSWSNPGDLVFDPMCGVATTLKMALLNDRQYLGMEIHKPYYDIAQRRMKMVRANHLRNIFEFLSSLSEEAA